MGLMKHSLNDQEEGEKTKIKKLRIFVSHERIC